MKIAKFQRVGYTDWFHIMEPCLDGTDPLTDSYIRVSEYVEAEFPPLPPAQIVPKQLAALDEAERKLRLELQEKLDAIAERRGQLLALTHEVQS